MKKSSFDKFKQLSKNELEKVKGGKTHYIIVNGRVIAVQV